ncbi:MAG: 30S ribosomal protein S14 [Gammaproteobacteria bacterium]|nr:30S ribosomal protein S14 [Gammaproteobacteria bacterium]
MAKTSMVEREKRRMKLFRRYGEKRKQLQEIICSITASDDERAAAQTALLKLPRDSSRSRQRHRCALCGRSRAFNRLTGLCRIHMRKAVMSRHVPGMRKASW